MATEDSAGGVLLPTYAELTRQSAAAAAPAAGKTRLYVDSNGIFQLVPDTGAADTLAKGSDVAAGRRTAPTHQNANYTFGLADEGKWFYSDAATPVTFTLPTEAQAPIPAGGFIDVAQYGSGALTVQAPAGVALAAGGTITATGGSWVLPGQYSVARLVKTSTGAWAIYPLSGGAATTWTSFQAASFSAGSPAPSYRKLPNGVVMLHGAVLANNNSFGLGQAMVILPAGYRPNGTISFIQAGWGNGGSWRCDIDANGNVMYGSGITGASGSGFYLHLSGINFYATN